MAHENAWLKFFEDDPLKVDIEGTVYEFRDPNLWTIGEVCDIEEAATTYKGIIPTVQKKARITMTLAKAIKDMDKATAAALPFYKAMALYELVGPKPFPLGKSPSGSLPPVEDQSQNLALDEP